MPATYTVKNNDFSQYDNDKMLTLTKIDKNQTHYYVDHRCPKCGGTGNIPYYGYIEDGVCFLCGGSGRADQKIVVRTAEYQATLNARRLAKMRKEAPAKNRELLEREGFSEQGLTYVVLGDTYAIKDELKAAGAKFSYLIGWHFPSKPETWPTFELSKDTEVAEGHTVFEEWPTGLIDWCPDILALKEYVQKIQNQYKASILPETKHFGQIGEKIERKCSFIKEGHYDTQFGTTYVYTFSDDEGHQFVWKTTTILNLVTGTAVVLKGTIKEHNEYKGNKQTMVTRCRVAAAA